MDHLEGMLLNIIQCTGQALPPSPSLSVPRPRAAPLLLDSDWGRVWSQGPGSRIPGRKLAAVAGPPPGSLPCAPGSWPCCRAVAPPGWRPASPPLCLTTILPLKFSTDKKAAIVFILERRRRAEKRDRGAWGGLGESENRRGGPRDKRGSEGGIFYLGARQGR